ncbi:MAG TPA: hypothetical protein VFM39_00790, partial [bacterium]|nr:hypothetical protein [bacterium]
MALLTYDPGTDRYEMPATLEFPQPISDPPQPVWPEDITLEAIPGKAYTRDPDTGIVTTHTGHAEEESMQLQARADWVESFAPQTQMLIAARVEGSIELLAIWEWPTREQIAIFRALYELIL